MAPASSRRRLIVNADDFGASTDINAAIIEAHRRGILTSTSLMVNGAAVDEAVRLAAANPKLGVGLHLTLCCGRSSLPRPRIPSLVDERQNFRNSPVLAGMIYFFSSAARRQLRDEIAAQFDKFAETGLILDHVNGHLHFHLHPTVFRLLASELEKRKVRALRLTRDPVKIDWPLGRGRWFYRASHAFIFSRLAARSQAFLDSNGTAYTRSVFGLLENARIDEDYILRLLPWLPVGDSELYSHPSLVEFKHEFDALISPRVADCIRAHQIELIRYQDLWRNC